jgi:hypothetical protein
MFEVRPDAYTDDPEKCDRRGPTVDSNAWCELCGVWVNCISAGCITRHDGKVTAHDNSPEACARRMAALKAEAEAEGEAGTRTSTRTSDE